MLLLHLVQGEGQYRHNAAVAHSPQQVGGPDPVEMGECLLNTINRERGFDSLATTLS